MSSISIGESPVVEAFRSIQWDSMEKLNLNIHEKSILRSGEDNPLEYILANREDSELYIKSLFKVLQESTGTSG